MWPVSDEFVTEVGRSHTVAVSAYVTDAAGNRTPLEVLSGSVTLDRTRDVRATCHVELADPDGTLTPDDAHDLLAPFGNELVLKRGVTFVDGTSELVPLGVFRITSFDVSDGADGLVIVLAGFDRSLVVQRNRWTDVYTIAAGTNVATAVASLLADRFPSVVTSFPAVSATTPRVVFEAGPSSDPWQDARTLAMSAGYELSFDREGTAVMTFPTSTATAAAASATFVEDDTAVMLEMSRGVSTAASVYNGVIVTGEGTGSDPVRAESWITDEAHPMYYLGPFGKVPMFFSTPLVTSTAQAQQAAQSRLAGLSGASESVEWGQVVNPALGPNDVVRVTRVRAGLDDVPLVLDAVTVPLEADGVMSASARRPFL